ncbi:MAG: TMEM165/GDT1 family protein [Xanthomonadales bacterium]|nr:TMEM165/GDT1 family protein [Xanthomonadales bacterium]
METTLVAFALVFLAELGDKTQLLTLLLAARWRRAAPIALGLLLASALSHLAASGLGFGLGRLLSAEWASRLAGLAFLGGGLWLLLQRDDEEPAEDVAPTARRPLAMILAAAGVYLLAELGDKTQMASGLLALERRSVLPVAAGATAAMLAANLPVLWLGARYAARLPRRLIATIAALVFAGVGVLMLVG